MLATAVLFLLVYGATWLVQRVAEALDAGDELLRRAQGAHRPFVLMDQDIA